MKLFKYSDGKFPTFQSEVVKRKGARKLYYVHDGRNAWWGAWVQRYLDGCMHSSWESAKRNAERLRVQGSVFYIAELPAIILEAETLVLAVTQINCTDVLSGYSPNAVSADPPLGMQLRENAHNNYLVPGSPIEGALMSFEPKSRFWVQPPPETNSVTCVVGVGGLSHFSGLAQDPLKGFKSFSTGGAYLLSWAPLSNPVVSRYVKKIVRVRAKHTNVSQRSGVTI